MAAIAFVYPILPGKLETWRNFCREMAGPRKKEHDESQRRLGVTTQRAWHQVTPMGDFAVVYSEASDVATFFSRMAESQEPFDVWFKKQVLEIHGLDFNQPPAGPLPELTIDYRTE